MSDTISLIYERKHSAPSPKSLPYSLVSPTEIFHARPSLFSCATCLVADHNEVAPPPKIALSVSRVIQDARLELKFSQKEVAQKVNEIPSFIQDYESSKAIPNTQILGKLEWVLSVKLQGTDIGKKLSDIKKS
ncbi:hypothetical protein CVT25_012536 [Psilocybe cyanescens]|uniref:HTH cro/C1-type domain-containing protein n=1 Tax=Psilocybe cyanescens TaxID=93625 RepID=A0A409XFR3_PSICY|nr:hypothetical protein CVT25_012536 [Psilocybe cyanescens]